MSPKVLYVGGFELPDKNAAAHRVISIGKIFRELKYDVYYIGVSKYLENRNSNIRDTQNVFNGFTYYSYPYPGKNTQWIKYLCSIPYIDLIEDIKPDIIVAYNFPSIALNKLRKYCKRHSIKIIADITEWYQAEGSIFFRIIKNIDTFLRMRVIHKKMDGLIPISKYLHNYYRQYSNNIIEIPPLVDLSDEKWDNFGCNTISPDAPIQLIYAGSPGGKDQLLKIILALKEIRHKVIINFTIIGISKEQFKLKYDDINAEMMSYLDSFVVFIEHLPHLDVINHIKHSDFTIFIRPETLVNTAGFPTKFVESISSGTPVITNLSSNLTEYLKDGINGFILNIDNDKKFISSLSRAFLCTKEQITTLKDNCRKIKSFDYREYLESFKLFIERTNSST